MAASSSLRFLKANRLLDAAAFGRVFKRATRSRDKLFTVLCRPNRENVARLGMAISKKHCRRATARNRLKRIVRESFRQHKNELEGFDVVVMNKAEAATASNKAVFESLEGHWRACRQRKQGANERE